jgi:ketosteroid isomerase-like protein
MTTHVHTASVDQASVDLLSEQLAEAFRTGAVSAEVFADDLFLDGHPPLWRFQLEGREVFASWLPNVTPADVSIVRTVPTASGFVAEWTGGHEEDGHYLSDRKIVLAGVRDGRVAELTVFCSGDWDEELRARHAAEATILRP